MKVLIIEDEIPAAKQLQKLIKAVNSEIEILSVQDSVRGAIQWLKTPPIQPELIFMDIQLADGLSFDIFQQVQIKTPVIFTTAFDHYTLKAFKVNSIDYLLKPIDPEELEKAIQKYETYYAPQSSVDYHQILQALQTQQQQFKKRFLIKTGQELKFVNTEDIHYFFSEEGLVFAQLGNGKKYNIDYTLEQLDELLDPVQYFRVNRKLILQLVSIQKIHTYFNGRLKLDLQPNPHFDSIVSRDRVASFKSWLDR